MTTSEILDAILYKRFEVDDRPRALLALNNRYAHLWSLEDWTFRYATFSPTTSPNTVALGGLPADLGAIVDLWDATNSEPLQYLPPTDFYRRNIPAASGNPSAYTIINGAVLLGPTPLQAQTWSGVYRKRLTLLADNSNSPAIPEPFHLALVHGARAELLPSFSDEGQAMEQLWNLDIEAMQREYLAEVEGEPSVWGSDPSVRGFSQWR